MQDQRSLLAQFLRFSSATVASLMVFSLYSIVDGLVVAKGVGDYAMAAVNLAVPFTNVMFSIAVTFAVGTSTILSIYLGQGNREHANRLFSQNLALLVVIVISDKLKKDKPVLSPAEKKAANRQLWLGGLLWNYGKSLDRTVVTC